MVFIYLSFYLITYLSICNIIFTKLIRLYYDRNFFFLSFQVHENRGGFQSECPTVQSWIHDNDVVDAGHVLRQYEHQRAHWPIEAH